MTRVLLLLALAGSGVAPAAAQRTAANRVTTEPRKLDLPVGTDSAVTIRVLDAEGREIPTERASLSAVSQNQAVALARVAGGRAIVSAVGQGDTEIRIGAAGSPAFAYVRIYVDAPGKPAVKTVPAREIKLAERELHLLVGERALLSATPFSQDGLPLSRDRLRFHSTDSSIVAADSLTGEITGRAVTSVPVSVIVMVPSQTAFAAVPVTVEPGDLTLTRDTFHLLAGVTDSLRLVVPSQGGRLYRGQPAFATANEKVVSIDPAAGIFTSLEPGAATLRATVTGRDYLAAVTVYPAPKLWGLPAALTEPVIIPVSVQRPFHFDALAGDSSALYTVPFHWTVEDTTVVGLDPVAQRLTGRKVGRTRVQGRSLLGGWSGDSVYAWTIQVIGGRVVADRSRIGLRVGGTDSVQVSALGPGDVALAEPPALTWTASGSGAVRVTTPGHFEAVGLGRTVLTGRAVWDSATSVLAFGVPHLLLSEAGTGRSVILGLVNGVPGATPLQGANGVDAEPAISPDRTRIVFSSLKSVKDTADLYLMDGDGLNATPLVTLPGREERPFWSHDGSRVLFTGTVAGRQRIFSVKADGTDVRPITDSLNPAPRGTLSPDGKWLVYETTRGGQYDLYQMPVTIDLHPAGKEAPLVATPDGERAPGYFPNGDLAFIRTDRRGKGNPILVRRRKDTVIEDTLTPPSVVVMDYAIDPGGEAVYLVAPRLGGKPTEARRVLYRLDIRRAGLEPELLYEGRLGSVSSPSVVR